MNTSRKFHENPHGTRLVVFPLTALLFATTYRLQLNIQISRHTKCNKHDKTHTKKVSQLFFELVKFTSLAGRNFGSVNSNYVSFEIFYHTGRMGMSCLRVLPCGLHNGISPRSLSNICRTSICRSLCVADSAGPGHLFRCMSSRSEDTGIALSPD